MCLFFGLLSRRSLVSKMVTVYKKLTLEERTRVVVLRNEGKSVREVAKIIGCNPKTVVRLCSKNAAGRSLEDSARSGRPRKTTIRDDRLVIRESLKNRRLTSSDLRASLEIHYNVSVTSRTIRNRLREAGLKGCVAVKKPLLRAEHRKRRLIFAREHADWTPADWESVLWSDESSFQLFSSSKRVFVRRREGERFTEQCIVPTVKHGGGSLMVWGCMSGRGVGRLYRCEGSMNQNQYLMVLNEYMLPSRADLYGTNAQFTFQQDNAPCHTAKRVTDFLQDSGVQVFRWPAQSPDLNPIENLWKILGMKVHERKPATLNELWHLLTTAWQDISAEVVRNLVNSMPSRCRAVIKAKGGHTKY